MKKQTHLHLGWLDMWTIPFSKLFQLIKMKECISKFSVCIFYSVAQLGVEAVVASILHLTVLPKVDFFHHRSLSSHSYKTETLSSLIWALQWLMGYSSVYYLSGVLVTFWFHFQAWKPLWILIIAIITVDTSTKIMLKLQEKKGKIKWQESAIFIIFPSNLVCLQMQVSLQTEMQ